MNFEIKYKTFKRDKTSDELQYNILLWLTNFECISAEIVFIKNLLETYPFKSNVPNLFERLQLFKQDLSRFESSKNKIVDKLYIFKNELSGMLECNDLSCDNFYVLEYEKNSEEVFNYMRDYKKLKTQLFEYITSITN